MSTVAGNPFVPSVTVWVAGHPAPQGSKSAKGRRRDGSVILVESSKRVKPWRKLVAEALVANGGRLLGPVSVGLVAVLPRPRTTKFPEVPAGPPDLDKLARAVGDAMTTSGVIEDDSRIVNFHRLAKVWTTPDSPEPGCWIDVRHPGSGVGDGVVRL